MVLGRGAEGGALPGGGTSVKIVLPSVPRRVRALKEVSGAMRGVKDTLYHTWRHGLLYTSYWDGGHIQKPMIQVDHIVFWDWMLKWFSKDISRLSYQNTDRASVGVLVQ